MTAQKSIQIALDEISAIDLTCKHCGSVIRMTLPKVSLSPAFYCVGCNTQLWLHESDAAYTNLLNVLRVLSRYKEIADLSKFKVGFSLISPLGRDVSARDD
jgi:hypothetical protein